MKHTKLTTLMAFYNKTFYEKNLQEYLAPDSYDLENKWAADDDFYLELVKGCEGEILDIACGTGRLTRAIAKLGKQVTGLDVMPQMLERAKQLADNEGLNIEWLHLDCRNFELDKTFDWILMTSHGFQHLLTEQDQIDFFTTIKKHLTKNGKLAFETRNLNNKTYGTHKEMKYKRSILNEKNEVIKIFLSTEYDEQTALDQVKFKRVNEATGVVSFSEIYLKYTTQVELNRLLTSCGYEIVHQFGNWKKEAVQVNSPELITICGKDDS